MEIVTIILSAAKAVGVSGILLVGICRHESADFTQNYAAYDKGSPSFGSCQIKEKTAFMFDFHGFPFELNDPRKNAHFAARYLKYQQDRYGNDWVRITAAYNAGSYLPGKIPGCPKNLKYIRLVQKKLPQELQEMLNCGISSEFAETE